MKMTPVTEIRLPFVSLALLNFNYQSPKIEEEPMTAFVSST